MKNRNKCLDCGNNHVPHLLLYAVQTTSYIMSQVPSLPVPSHNNKILRISNWLLERLRIIKWTTKLETTSSRTEVILEAAKKQSVSLEQQHLFGQSSDTYRFRVGSAYHEFYSIPTLDDNEQTRRKLDNKWQTKKILQNFDAPTPKGFVVRTKKQLRERLNELAYPVVIKPAQGSRGRHTHVYLRNIAEAINAFKNAKKICMYIVCEEMIEGDVYRFTTIFGETVAVLRGEVPSVMGDGKNTVKELLFNKNKARPSGVAPLQLNQALKEILHRQDLSLNSIPAKDKKIMLGQKIGLKYGGDAVEVTPSVHGSFSDAINLVSAKLPLTVLGFDVIALDISAPADTQRWGIIEINTIPFIDLHHFPRAGKPVDVASLLWIKIIQKAQE